MSLELPFTREEYLERLDRVRGDMTQRELDLLLIADPASQNWLTGHEGWSFYTPQLVAVAHDREPIWLGRAMDAPGARMTTYMDDGAVVPYPEDHVQKTDVHPVDFMADHLRGAGFDGKRIGVELDSYYFSPRSLDCLKAGLPNAEFCNGDLLVNWARVVKSAAEIDTMRRAARLVETAMTTAYDTIAPGVRQCDAVGAIYRSQVAGQAEFSGDLTSLCPIILAGAAATTAHPIWSDAPFEADQTIALELGGAHKRYTCALARTMRLGQPPRKLMDTAAAVEEGLKAVLDTIAPGVTAGQVHSAWQRVLDRHGLTKESRIGYSIGVGYPPDWGEHTVSLRAGETTVLQANMTIHVMLGMWLDDWGMELSETVRVTETGVECLTSFPRDVFVKG
ncbi:MAG: M24 family metallopeptidase [Pseudomonadota bacterium]